MHGIFGTQLVWLGLLNDAREVVSITQVGAGLMRVLVEMIDALSVKRVRLAFDAMHDAAFSSRNLTRQESFFPMMPEMSVF